MQLLFDGHVLDTSLRELRCDGQVVSLEPLVFDLLVYLVTNRDRVVSKDDVLGSVWSGRIVSESALTTRIAAARRAIGDSGEAQKLIRTIARKGFRFVGGVREQANAAVVETGDSRVATPALGLPDRPSIAVLPFANMSSDPEQEYFSDGMADDIITELSHERSLFVIARNSSFTYKGRAVDVKLVARELGVRYVLEGSVRRNGAQIRVNAQLIDAETGSHIWAGRYDRAVEAVFAVQDEITVAVARAIHPAISHAERQRAMRKPPENLSAWEAWHRALGFLSKRDISGLREFLQRAVTLDPGFASAHAMLAFLYTAESTRGIGLSLPESARMAEAAARTAIELDPSSAIAHAMLAWTLGHLGEWASALEAAEIAIGLNPNDPWGYLGKAHPLMYSGSPAAARELLGTALRLDPRGPVAPLVLHLRAICHYLERNYREAEATARRAIQEYPEYPRPRITFAASLGQLGRAAEAGTALEAAISAAPLILKFITDSRSPHYRPDYYEHLIDGLRKAGWTG